jgi:hypothetical protein
VIQDSLTDGGLEPGTDLVEISGELGRLGRRVDGVDEEGDVAGDGGGGFLPVPHVLVQLAVFPGGIDQLEEVRVVGGE